MSSEPSAHDIRRPIDGRQLAIRRLGATTPGRPTLVFLHEGLGSISQWRGFPERLCATLGLDGLLYSRAGYGHSDPAPLPRPVGFMHHEARVVLPALLEAEAVSEAILVGHSDGGSIALIAAAAREPRVRAVIALAPHLFVEAITVASIRGLRERLVDPAQLARFGRHHRDPGTTCEGWFDVWLRPAFAAWSIEDEVGRITVPVLALQGLDDEYGTMAQLRRLGERVPHARWSGLAACGHSPHVDQPDAVLRACVDFVRPLITAP